MQSKQKHLFVSRILKRRLVEKTDLTEAAAFGLFMICLSYKQWMSLGEMVLIRFHDEAQLI